MPVFNHLGVNDSPKREVHQDACLHWEGREKSPKHSGLSLAPDDFRDENEILILPRGFCYAQKKENRGLVCNPSHILSAKLPVSILVLVLKSVLFISLTIANPLLPQFFLSPPFPFLLTSVSPYWTTEYWNYISFWGKAKKEKREISGSDFCKAVIQTGTVKLSSYNKVSRTAKFFCNGVARHKACSSWGGFWRHTWSAAQAVVDAVFDSAYQQ